MNLIEWLRTAQLSKIDAAERNAKLQMEFDDLALVETHNVRLSQQLKETRRQFLAGKRGNEELRLEMLEMEQRLELEAAKERETMTSDLTIATVTYRQLGE